VYSSSAVVADPASGDSVGSRVLLATLGHHGDWRYAGQSIDVIPQSSCSGLGTTETAAIDGGGGLALLFGAYALIRRIGTGNTEPDQPSPPSSESETSSDTTAVSSPQRSSGSNPGDTIDELLEAATQTLDGAERLSDTGEYDRALARTR